MSKNLMNFFGFKEEPFERMPDTDFYFLSPHFQEILKALEDFLSSESLFFALIGTAGTGKSATIQRFIQDLPKSTEFLYIGFPNISPEELFYAALENFGQITEKGLPKEKLTHKLKEFLDDPNQKDKKFVIFIEETQKMPTETLEELRILTEFCQNKTIKVVLAGQPSLETRLKSEGLTLINQHLFGTMQLKNLSKEEITEYIRKRLAKASRKGVSVSGGAIADIWDVTHGNPRHINTVMERALMAAFMDGSHSVKAKHVDSAVKSINIVMANNKNIRNKRLIYVVAAVLAVFMLAGVYKYFSGTKQPTQVATVEPYVPPIIIETPKSVEPETIEPKEAEITEKPVLPPEPPVVVTPPPPPPPPPPPAATATTGFSAGDAVFTTAAVNVRATPGLSGERIGGFPTGQRIVIVRETENWIMIDYNGRNGWIYKEFVQREQP